MTLVLIDDNEPARTLRRVPRGEARHEHTLRDLIALHPELLPVAELDPDCGLPITVAREFGIPGAGFADLFLIDPGGRLIIVECKLWRNPEARRQVVGQVLDYAQALSRLSYETLQARVSAATGQAGNALYALAHDAGSAMDEAAFVDRVSRNLVEGRFLLFIVGDGIGRGTANIAEYLQARPALGFELGLVEMAEYRDTRTDGSSHTTFHARMLARTLVLERHVIRLEAPGVSVTPLAAASASTAILSDAGTAWRRFAEAFTAEIEFDDPAQPDPRSGGIGWIRVPLPHGLYLNAYRSIAEGGLGVQMKLSGTGCMPIYQQLLDAREEIDAEFAASGLPAPEWITGSEPAILLRSSSPQPWHEAVEIAQRQWLGRAANQFVNSLRPRLGAIEGALAA